MAELTELEEKLAEVMGLAQAAQGLTKKVGGMVEDERLAGMLDRMGEEAAETEERCTQLADELDGKKTALQEKARETKQEAESMAKDYLGDDADALDGFEFMIMAEGGELVLRRDRGRDEREDRRAGGGASSSSGRSPSSSAISRTRAAPPSSWQPSRRRPQRSPRKLSERSEISSGCSSTTKWLAPGTTSSWIESTVATARSTDASGMTWSRSPNRISVGTA